MASPVMKLPGTFIFNEDTGQVPYYIFLVVRISFTVFPTCKNIMCTMHNNGVQCIYLPICAFIVVITIPHINIDCLSNVPSQYIYG